MENYHCGQGPFTWSQFHLKHKFVLNIYLVSLMKYTKLVVFNKFNEWKPLVKPVQIQFYPVSCYTKLPNLFQFQIVPFWMKPTSCKQQIFSRLIIENSFSLLILEEFWSREEQIIVSLEQVGEFYSCTSYVFPITISCLVC